MRSRARRPAALSLMLACALTSPACGGGGGASTPTPAPTPEHLSTLHTLSFSEPPLAAHDTGLLAPMDGGGYLYASLADGTASVPYGLIVAFIGDDLTVAWAQLLDVSAIPTGVASFGPTVYLLAAPQAVAQLYVIELVGGTGEIVRTRSLDGIGSARGITLPDDGLVVSGLYGIARLDLNLDVVWAQSWPGGAVVEDDAGFTFAGVGFNSNSTATGVQLVATTDDGTPRWRAFNTSGPGNHNIAGLRTTPGGYLVAAGNDSARSDSDAALSPLILAHFDADGEVDGLQDVSLMTEDNDGYAVPLQFGAGYSLVAREDETWVGFLANSGALGADLRGRIVARIGLDRQGRGAVWAGLHVAPTVDGAAMTLSPDALPPTLTRSAPGAVDCATTVDMILTEIPDRPEREEAPAPRPLTLTSTEVSLNPVPMTITTDEVCRSP